MEKKPGAFFFKRLGKKKGGGGWWRNWRLKSSGFRWKGLRFRIWFVDGFLFKILSICEAIVLVANLCFFYLCCGCHI
ncbi:hypothetical protein RHGRI_028195 [Rhododendron griersonianum]|uniref:Transmembrane protein n=1 Tax=Rhododendron griersonianum TaxID=479676 RepID=A0AAV6IH77_9ERIC|nr:hypothetical protein RHGRI_028195 [Rhododendron griersonianum]